MSCSLPGLNSIAGLARAARVSDVRTIDALVALGLSVAGLAMYAGRSGETGDFRSNDALGAVLHQPWTIFGSVLEGIFCLAFPSRRYRSSVMGMVMHSGQTVFFIIVALGLVLGLA